MTIEQTIEILSQIDAYDEKEIEAIDKAKTVLERQIPRCKILWFLWASFRLE
jgi:hypothetical protein